jgi:uncharacterized membrane protein (DUF485 family)
MVEGRAEDPVIPLSLFKNRIFVNATAIGFTLGLGMFSAIAFVPTFLQMSSGTSASESGLLMLPMMVGLVGTSIYIRRAGRTRNGGSPEDLHHRHRFHRRTAFHTQQHPSTHHRQDPSKLPMWISNACG